MTDYLATAAANNGRQIVDAAYLQVLAARPNFTSITEHACTSLCTANCTLA